MRHFISFLAISLVSAVSFAQSPLAIAGIHIGDTPIQVQTLTQANGYKPDSSNSLVGPVSKGPSFRDLVKVGGGYSKAKTAIKKLRFVKGKQHLEVTFIPWPDGEKVSEVFYRQKDTAISFDDMLRIAKEKYGEPAVPPSKYRAKWSQAPLNKKHGIDINKPHISLNMMPADSPTLHLATNRLNTSKKLKALIKEASGPAATDF